MKALKIFARHLSRAGLVSIGLGVAAVFFAAALVLRLLVGPVSLGPLTEQLRISLGRILPGLAVRFDDAALQWSRDEERLSLVIMGARVYDENQRIIAQAPEAEVGLAVWPLLHGHAVVNKIALLGVQLTLVHGKDGVLRLGVEGERGQSDVLQRIRDALSKGGNAGASLHTVAVRNARLAFYEEETGVFVVAPDANLQVSTGNGTPGNPVGATRATIDAKIEISGRPAKVNAAFILPANGDNVEADMSVSGLHLNSLAANSNFFSFLAPFALNADVTGSFELEHGTHVRSADFGVSTEGTINGLGRPLHVRSFRVSGRYDGATGRLLIDDATLAGNQAQAHLEGQGDLAFDPQGALQKASLNLDLDKIAVNMPGVMGHAVTVEHAALRGSYIPATQTVAIDQALVFGGALSAKFSGKVNLVSGQSPEIDMNGSVSEIDIRDFLRYWPLQAGPGAREWIDANVAAGKLGPIVLHTHVPAGALDAPALADNALLLTFPIAGATISYIHGMTPLTGVSGTATLTGDTFKADVASAAIGPLSLAHGTVLIPNLHQHGTVGAISAHVEGNVHDVLTLVDQKPLQYPTRFHIRTATAKGTAAVDLNVKVPMLHDVKVDDIGILVHAVTTGFGIALSDHLTIANSNVDFLVNNTSLRAVGNVTAGAASLGVDWTEAFKPVDAISSRIKINGMLDDEARAGFGIHLQSFLSGPIAVSGELDGLRGEIQRAQLQLDLSSATLSLNELGYKKPASVPAHADVGLKFDQAGTVRNADFSLAGTDLAANGAARFGANGSLQSLELPAFRAGAAEDFTLSLVRDPAEGTTVAISGRSFDGELLLQHEAQKDVAQSTEKPQSPPESYHVTAKLDRVVMHQGAVFAPFALDISGAGNIPRTLSLSTMITKTASLSGQITNTQGTRHLSLSAGDAGLLLKALFGTTSLKGGTLSLDATPGASPAEGEVAPADYAGKLVLEDFTVINQPFLTRLFSAGSFLGMADLLRGKGIGIDKLEIPFVMRGDVMTIREARATGPSLGLTADGYYDLRANQIGLQGTFAPLYGLNSVLGVIPLLGNVLVSKKGEGIFGVTYSASGDADDPKVSVNPLSVLTPGILRRVFEGRIPSAPPPQANTTPPAPPDKPQ